MRNKMNLAVRVILAAFGIMALSASANQTLVLDGAASGKRFDGIGAVSGGGATSVLLKDYKCFDFGDTILPGQSSLFTLQFRDAQASGQVEVWLGDPKGDGEKLAAISVDKQELIKSAWRKIMIPVRNISGHHGVYFKFISEEKDTPITDLRSFAFTRDTQ